MNKECILNKIIKISTILILLTFISACSSKSSKINDPSNPTGNSSLSESDLNLNRAARFKDGALPEAEGGSLFKDVNFNYDSSVISGEAQQNLERNAEILRNNANIKVQLEGHCDERGTVEYNLTLGNKRARSVYDALVAMGIRASRLSTISYGEELPLDTASNKAAWAKNRRVHFSAYTE